MRIYIYLFIISVLTSDEGTLHVSPFGTFKIAMYKHVNFMQIMQ